MNGTCSNCMCVEVCKIYTWHYGSPEDTIPCPHFINKNLYTRHPSWEFMRNGDRIRAMSDEELAKKIPCPYIKGEYDECKFGWHERTQTCEECALEWLRRFARNGDNDV